MERHFIQKRTFFAEIVGFLSLLKRWGTNPALQNQETRGVGFPPALSRQEGGGATFKAGQHAKLGEVVEPTAPEKADCQPGTEGRAMEIPLNAKMYKKPKGIAVRSENHQECMSMKKKDLAYAEGAGPVMEKAYGK
jgi:hypothetical protein